MSKAKIIRLTSGEELIAKTEITDTHVKMKKPAILMPAGKDQLGFGQWIPYTKAEEGIEIERTFVLFIIDPMEELVTQYDSMFGSGLIVPDATKKLVTPNLKFAGAE